MSYHHAHHSSAHTGTRAAAHLSGPSGIARPAASRQKPVVQRVIAGLEDFQTPESIPAEWLNAYHQSLLDSSAFLSEDQVWNIFQRVVGPGMPYHYGMAINHVGGNHWTLTHKGITYNILGDGSCGIHAVHLAAHLHAGGTADPVTPYAAPPDFVTAQRKALYDNLVHVDNLDHSNDEARKHISLAITNAEFIFETGLGPDLQQVLKEESIRRNQENLNKLLEQGYADYWRIRKKAIDDLPKPSEARKEYQSDEFFKKAQSKRKLDEILTLAISTVHKKNNSSISLDFSDKVYQKAILECLSRARKNFRSPAEIKMELAKIKSAFKAKAAKRKRLAGNRFLTKEQETALRQRLKNPIFRKKILKASRLAVLRFKKEKKDGGLTKMIGEGTLDLKGVQVSSGQMMEALHAFTSTTFTSKNDLAVGSGNGSHTSIGQGGLQVKGLDTYPEEMNWFTERIARWKVHPKDLFQAIMLRDEEGLKRLTKASAAEMKHMLSFRILQLEEIFRGMQFGIGVAAHLNLGFHGQSDVSGYLSNMPMYAGGATTNVTQTADWNAPHNPTLWTQQEQSTMSGIEQLAQVSLEQGQVYNMNAQTYLTHLHAEPIDAEEPTDELVEQTFHMMMSPNPYINDDDVGSPP